MEGKSGSSGSSGQEEQRTKKSKSEILRERMEMYCPKDEASRDAMAWDFHYGPFNEFRAIRAQRRSERLAIIESSCPEEKLGESTIFCSHETVDSNSEEIETNPVNEDLTANDETLPPIPEVINWDEWDLVYADNGAVGALDEEPISSCPLKVLHIGHRRVFLRPKIADPEPIPPEASQQAESVISIPRRPSAWWNLWGLFRRRNRKVLPMSIIKTRNESPPVQPKVHPKDFHFVEAGNWWIEAKTRNADDDRQEAKILESMPKSESYVATPTDLSLSSLSQMSDIAPPEIMNRKKTMIEESKMKDAVIYGPLIPSDFAVDRIIPRRRSKRTEKKLERVRASLKRTLRPNPAEELWDLDAEFLDQKFRFIRNKMASNRSQDLRPIGYKNTSWLKSTKQKFLEKLFLKNKQGEMTGKLSEDEITERFWANPKEKR